MFSNVPRHNGFEAFRRLVELVNEDKALVRKDLLSLVVHAKSATSMDDLQSALKVWDTHKRLFEKADGVLPSPDQERLALIGLLAPDIFSNVTMELEKPGFGTFQEVKKYALKLVKVLQNQKRHRRGRLNLVDAYRGELEEEPVYEEEEVDFEKGIAEIMALDLAPDAQAAEINAFVTKKSRPTRSGRPLRIAEVSFCARPPAAERHGRRPMHELQ